MLSEEGNFEELSPNYAIVINCGKGDNVKNFEKYLDAKSIDIHGLVRPGSSDSNRYIFIAIDSIAERDVLFEVKEQLSFVDKIIPINDIKLTRQSESLVKKIVKEKSLVPKDSDLFKLSNLNRNDELALYFIFYKRYIKWLMPLSLIGLVFRVISSHYEFNLVYSVFVSLYSIAFAVQWIYKIKPGYMKKLDKSMNDNEVDLELSKTMILKKVCFIPILVFFIGLLVSFQFLCFFTEIFITQLYSGPLKGICTLIPTVAISLFVPILTYVYNTYFVEYFVIWENCNNPTRSRLEKNLALTFFTSYMPLLITLFFYFPLGYKLDSSIKSKIATYAAKFFLSTNDTDFKVDLNRHQNQVFYFLVTNQIILTLMDNVVPIIVNKFITPLMQSKVKKIDPKKSKNELANNIRTMNSMYQQDSILWTHVKDLDLSPYGEFNINENTKQIIAQFGYVLMFSTIWPLAPFILIFFNALIFKLDLSRAYKKCLPSIEVQALQKSNSSSTTSVENLNKPIEKMKSLSLWDFVLSFMACLGSVVCLTLTYMYGYSNLPNIGHNTYSIKSKTWYKRSPLNHSAFSILLLAVVIEHLAVFVFYIFAKFYVAEDKQCNGYVPTLDLVKTMATNATKSEKTWDSKSQKTQGLAADANKTSFEIEHIPDSATNTSGFTKAAGIDEINQAQPLPIHKPMPKTKTSQPTTSTTTSTTTSKTTAFPHVATSSVTPSKPTNSVANDSNKAEAVSSTGPKQNQKPEDSENHTKENQANDIHSVDSSSDAGATLPDTIPTSKNYYLRYDKDGNLIAAKHQSNSKQTQQPLASVVQEAVETPKGQSSTTAASDTKTEIPLSIKKLTKSVNDDKSSNSSSKALKSERKVSSSTAVPSIEKSSKVEKEAAPLSSIETQDKSLAEPLAEKSTGTPAEKPVENLAKTDQKAALKQEPVEKRQSQSTNNTRDSPSIKSEPVKKSSTKKKTPKTSNDHKLRSLKSKSTSLNAPSKSEKTEVHKHKRSFLSKLRNKL